VCVCVCVCSSNFVWSGNLKKGRPRPDLGRDIAGRDKKYSQIIV